ncbi:MAG: BirA family biotin operon repressor/biotin-[acetyl-CoA-carboxylase] ligase [Myxococcota bacterium]|jgi:BirA family biotin operon repressor/biotin-[acetyl-CoA-carboxylase] ligase
MDRVALIEAIAQGPISGEALASRFGVSRAMVWKDIETLRGEGLTIASKQGYVLEDAAGFGEATLSWRCARPVTFLSSTTSTNAIARDLARKGDHRAVVVADYQTAGRGRRGRTWASRSGDNLLFSVVLTPDVPPQHAPRCVLIWAAAMAEVLGVRLKWPNDLVDADGGKLGGILAELEAEGESVRFVILGVGLNINQEHFDDLPQATSLRRLRGAPRDRAALLADLLAAIEGADVLGGSLEGWRKVSNTLGRRVRINGIEGIAQDVRDDGALIVDGQAVLAGDVELVAT